MPRASELSRQLAQRLVTELRSDRADLPVLPQIAVEVWEMSRDPDFDVDRLRVTLEREPALAGRVLGVASCPLYAGKAPVTSLRDALMRLGRRTLADVLLEVAATMEVFRATDYQPAMLTLQKHALAVAYVARDVAQIAGVEPGIAFMAGLLHDVGTVALLRVVACSERRQRKAISPLGEIIEAIDDLHARTGSYLVHRWGLPDEVGHAILAHQSMLVDDEPCRLAATVSLADSLAAEAGIPGLDGNEPQAELAQTILELSAESMTILRQRSQEVSHHLGARAAAA